MQLLLTHQPPPDYVPNEVVTGTYTIDAPSIIRQTRNEYMSWRSDVINTDRILRNFLLTFPTMPPVTAHKLLISELSYTWNITTQTLTVGELRENDNIKQMDWTRT